ncbi:hypothetical protein SUGI_0951230 [Cryptomeria japonica]|nr:hypothetical protein SUGI_0951230 [Cryptomeria japonica]
MHEACERNAQCVQEQCMRRVRAMHECIATVDADSRNGDPLRSRRWCLSPVVFIPSAVAAAVDPFLVVDPGCP